MRGLNLEDVAEAVGTSRRTLERRFRAVLRDSVLGEIRRMRIEHAKHLLAESDLKLAVIARQCGIHSPARLTTVFRQLTGYAPSVFRRLAGHRHVDRV